MMKSVPNRADVIVLDGNQRSTLAVTRSLGRRGIKVAVGAESICTLSSSSKYCFHSLLYPSPYGDSQEFIKALVKHTSNYKDIPMFPMTDVTLDETLRNSDTLRNHARIPFGSYESYSTASNKVDLFLLARDLNIPIPDTLFPVDYKNLEDLIHSSKALGFPLVVKPFRSRIRLEDGWLNTHVRYPQDVHELRNILESWPFRDFPFIVQKRVTGPGIGVFLLIYDGCVYATFAHQRIREKPPSGGVSVVCKSIEAPTEALNAASKLLEKLCWSGVAMVEFKWDAMDNSPKLMEINARFWGSLQLAISAGVDFPYLLFCLINGQKISPVKTYRIGLKSRWELGDLDHLLLRMRKKPSELSLPFDAPAKWRAPMDFVTDFFNPSVRHEILRPDDPGPFLFELKAYLRGLGKKADPSRVSPPCWGQYC